MVCLTIFYVACWIVVYWETVGNWLFDFLIFFIAMPSHLMSPGWHASLFIIIVCTAINLNKKENKTSYFIVVKILKHSVTKNF